VVAGDVVAAGAGEARDALLLGADVDAEVGRDAGTPSSFETVHLPGFACPEDERLGERPAAGVAAGAAVGVRQHALDVVDPRVLGDVELALRQHQQRGEQEGEASERPEGGQHDVQRFRSPSPGLREPSGGSQRSDRPPGKTPHAGVGGGPPIGGRMRASDRRLRR
jgi:hypothetical protein